MAVYRWYVSTQGNDKFQCAGGMHVQRGMIHGCAQMWCIYIGEYASGGHVCMKYACTQGLVHGCV